MHSREPGRRIDEMLAKLREREFRITPQRLAILKILAASEGHPSVDDIYREVKAEFPTTSLATVYKTVSLLKELNEALELSFPDGSNRYDGNNPAPHPHAICVKCKRIMDPELMNIDALTEEMSRKTGYKIFYHELEFFGLCPECQKKN
ncbi:MAG: Peroxide operon regulator [Syntrophaceae bacterium PtaB.Bin038]|jgi:Fur family peroxide stress response transcriptional regulator|nr:MAG: Peroxide operon regulator [Syntrophaceae bacterium PtaB.Bin038]